MPLELKRDAAQPEPSPKERSIDSQPLTCVPRKPGLAGSVPVPIDRREPARGGVKGGRHGVRLWPTRQAERLALRFGSELSVPFARNTNARSSMVTGAVMPHGNPIKSSLFENVG